ncbi:MAG TPA: TatD family hydrolase, partial [Longimicrobiaceae bacterium]|nr:TatD family hydrolase [Longimicrobiaceae bacterium]
MIDSHAHLTDARFAGEVEGVLERARDAGVEAVVSIATEPETARAALALAERFPNVYATAGIHPHSVGEATEASYAAVRELLGHPRVVAVGEVGMDFHYDFAPAHVQRAALLRQMEIAREMDLPLIVHAREADEALTAILREAGPGTRGVLHSFSSGRELL